jgi:hypothetical protein
MKRTSPDPKTSTASTAIKLVLSEKRPNKNHGRKKRQVSHRSQQYVSLFRDAIAQAKADIQRIEEACIQLESAQYSLANVHINKIAKTYPPDHPNRATLLDALDSNDRRYTEITKLLDDCQDEIRRRIDGFQVSLQELDDDGSSSGEA